MEGETGVRGGSRYWNIGDTGGHGERGVSKSTGTHPLATLGDTERGESENDLTDEVRTQTDTGQLERWHQEGMVLDHNTRTHTSTVLRFTYAYLCLLMLCVRIAYV